MQQGQSGSELQRIAALHSYDILDTAEEKEFNDLVELAAMICNCPASAISFVDKDRQWFKAHKNIPVRQSSLSESFCAQTIQQNDVMIIEDASKHPHFKTYPSVIAEPGIRFYAGSPVVSATGQNIGSICVIDMQPRKLNSDQVKALQMLSAQVSKLLELRLVNKKLQRRSNQLVRSAESYRDFFNNAPFPQWIFNLEKLSFLAVNKASVQLYGYTEKEFQQMNMLEIVSDDRSQYDRINGELRQFNKSRFIDTHRKKDGTKIVVEVTVNYIHYGQPEMIIATIIDLSEKLHLQEKITTYQEETDRKVQHATLFAQSQEREYLGKELHDNINQMIASAGLYLDLAYTRDDMRLDLIKRSKEHLITVMRAIRDLSSKMAASSPHGLDLADAVEELLGPYYLSGSFKLNYSASGDLHSLPVDMKIAMLRILQEAIHNVAKYAHASEVTIELEVDNPVRLLIRDNGQGFDVSAQRSGIGIRNIHERARQFRGTAQIDSAPGKGCEVRFCLPLGLV
ncbi:MAG TPA: GAF domain-containing protein [Chitinophagaceae bacterium]|nr:GAF domain-containing protein [Chitinophagaceae bacterium]